MHIFVSHPVHSVRHKELQACGVRRVLRSRTLHLPTIHRGLRANRARPIQSWYLNLHPADQILMQYSSVNHSTIIISCKTKRK